MNPVTITLNDVKFIFAMKRSTPGGLTKVASDVKLELSLKVRFSMAYQNILDEILDKVDEMPLEDQGMLVELIRNRYKEKRREDDGDTAGGSALVITGGIPLGLNSVRIRFSGLY